MVHYWLGMGIVRGTARDYFWGRGIGIIRLLFFLNIKTYNLVDYKCFRRNYRLLSYSALKMEAAEFSEKFVQRC